ncbi:hypothetical protein [Candidatus Solirubrobacter pratensis]|uniref:hypothetical protein n=1 Tax=Candidatus Solirubrobacter pratensis TaxID=1298857 RepID=UPI00047F5F1C|nr:hypothetical protein [Candidatus Solirubrobacter pratensis]
MSVADTPEVLDPLGLAELLAPIRERYDEAIHEYREHLAGLARTEKGILQLHGILQSAGMDVELPPEIEVAPAASGKKPAKKKAARRTYVMRANGTATGHGISMEAAKPFADAVLKLVDERAAAGQEPLVTQTEIYRALGEDQTKGSAAFRWFRAIEFIGKAGRQAGDRGSMLMYWRVLKRHAVDEAIAAAERAADEEMSAAVPDDPQMRNVLDFIEQEGHVRGWSTLARACDLSDRDLSSVKAKLRVSELVEVDSSPGRSATIQWKGDSNGGPS